MARCLQIPIPTLPALPSPFGIPTLTTPAIGIGEINLCCRLPPVGIPAIPIPIPAQLLTVPGLATIVNAAVDLIIGYINELPLKCPVE